MEVGLSKILGIAIGDFTVYVLAKLAFVIWLQHPTFEGAMILNSQLLRPWKKQFDSHSSQLEEKLETVADSLKTFQASHSGAKKTKLEEEEEDKE